MSNNNSFDVNDRSSWYFGMMSRQDAADLLLNEREGGVFLVRDSNTNLGDYVLCVKEDTKVSHYIINKLQRSDQMVYRIGDQLFPNLPELLAFYKLHYLDTTPLRRPATRKYEKVIGKFDFDGSDSDDLPFKKGDILDVINKDEDQWWTAKDANGKIGQIPVPYVQKYEEAQVPTMDKHGGPGSAVGITSGSIIGGGTIGGNHIATGFGLSGLTTSQLTDTTTKKKQRSLPAIARVKQARVPNAYDKTALKLEIGDEIIVTNTNINGQWEGELRGKKGHFPFTHVEFIDKPVSKLFGGNSGTAASAGNVGSGGVGAEERWGD